jgi:hypothetical protein
LIGMTQVSTNICARRAALATRGYPTLTTMKLS